MHFCLTPQDPKYGTLQLKRRDDQKPKFPRTIQVVSEARRLSADQPSDKNRIGNKDAKGNQQPKKHCPTCNLTSHNKEECWKTFPELKAKFLKDQSQRKRIGRGNKRGASAPPPPKARVPPSTPSTSMANIKRETVSQVQTVERKPEAVATAASTSTDSDFQQ